MSLEIGIGTISGQLPARDTRTAADSYQDVLDLARLADEVGFDAFWISSHHGAPKSQLPSPIVMLAAVAAVTRRIRLGSSVVVAPFQHPLRFAEDCAVVDQLSRGRLSVGLGSGWRDSEFRAFGISMKERGGRTEELARICRSAWDEERFSFHGKYFSYDDVQVVPRPVGHLPLVMGGTSASAIARAGRLADGFIATGYPQNQLQGFRAEVEAFDRAARAAGRDPGRLVIGFHVNVWVSEDGSVPATVRDAMWHKVGQSLAWHAGRAVEHAEDLPAIDEERLRSRGFIGRPAEVIRQVVPWLEAFAGRRMHLLFRLYHPGMTWREAEPALRLCAREVIPALKEVAGRGGPGPVGAERA